MDIANEMDKNETKLLAKTLEPVSGNEIDTTNLSFTSPTDESLKYENPKNPMLLCPVIRCIFKFLNIEEIKNGRLVCREWGSIGKITLANRAIISFNSFDNWAFRLPADFQSCFLNSAILFSAFKISGHLTKDFSRCDPWTIAELTKFFDEQQSCIRELTLNFKYWDKNLVKNININSWISKSALVQKDAQCMTKLSIKGTFWSLLDIPPLHLIAHIKDLTLSRCRINLEAETRISAIKLKLKNSTFFKNGIELDRVLINDIVDLGKAKEISLNCKETPTLYVLDLLGNTTLDNLTLKRCEIVNGGTSQWVIKHLEMHL